MALPAAAAFSGAASRQVIRGLSSISGPYPRVYCRVQFEEHRRQEQA